MSRACRSVRRAILERDPAELREALGPDAGGTPLHRHLEECPGCRLAAARVLAGQEELGRAIDAARPRTATAPVLARALAERVPGALPGREREAGPPPESAADPRRSARPLRTALAAAALAGLLLLGRDLGPPEAELPPPRRVTTVPATVAEAPPGKRLVVLKPSDPTITVVWLY